MSSLDFGAAVTTALQARGLSVEFEYPGFVAVYLPDGRYVATGLNGWEYADLCQADGDAAGDESIDTGLPSEPADESPATVERFADTLATLSRTL